MASPAIPPDFGEPNGTPITNKSTVLREIDAALGCSKPPAVEYLLVRPFSIIRIPFTNVGICWNSFGHSAVRYTLPSGEEVVSDLLCGQRLCRARLVVKAKSPATPCRL